MKKSLVLLSALLLVTALPNAGANAPFNAPVIEIVTETIDSGESEKSPIEIYCTDDESTW